MRPLLLALLVLPLTAFGADKGAASAARQAYQQERAECMQRTGDERRTCLREAGAALQEARKGTLVHDGEDYAQNQFIRCEVHRVALDRELCERRMRGEGTQTGSVEGGGILRELTVTVPAEEGGEASYGSDSFSTPQTGSGPGQTK